MGELRHDGCYNPICYFNGKTEFQIQPTQRNHIKLTKLSPILRQRVHRILQNLLDSDFTNRKNKPTSGFGGKPELKIQTTQRTHPKFANLISSVLKLTVQSSSRHARFSGFTN